MVDIRHLAIIVGVALLGMLPPGSAWGAEEPGALRDDLVVTCGPPPPGHLIRGKIDYRQGHMNSVNQRDFLSMERRHLRPARARVSSGKNLDWDVMNNLHFILSKVPNHEQALQVLIDWDLMGGRHHSQQFAAPACYIVWAAQFAPDDVVVWNYGGFYFQRKGDTRRAMKWWQQALLVDPANPDVNYTLGLIAFDNGEYHQARSHAQAAYAGGYPLPALRNKLKSAGQWQEPPAAAGPHGQ